ncbi:hypothetical protein DFS34DRAFT_619795 [Phlyctochytrium arcticum]|nr:hypothetical protein DFS34DRAFT_619795 [Phlyctochytrium arcticum]
MSLLTRTLGAARRTPAVLLTQFPSVAVPSRTLYRKASPPSLPYTKKAIDRKVLDLLLDYVKTNPEKTSMEANLVTGLGISKLDRFAFYWDLQTEFQFLIPATRHDVRDLQSGREAADWVAAILEQQERLVV